MGRLRQRVDARRYSVTSPPRIGRSKMASSPRCPERNTLLLWPSRRALVAAHSASGATPTPNATAASTRCSGCQSCGLPVGSNMMTAPARVATSRSVRAVVVSQAWATAAATEWHGRWGRSTRRCKLQRRSWPGASENTKWPSRGWNETCDTGALQLVATSSRSSDGPRSCPRRSSSWGAHNDSVHEGGRAAGSDGRGLSWTCGGTEGRGKRARAAARTGWQAAAPRRRQERGGGHVRSAKRLRAPGGGAGWQLARRAVPCRAFKTAMDRTGAST